MSVETARYFPSEWLRIDSHIGLLNGEPDASIIVFVSLDLAYFDPATPVIQARFLPNSGIDHFFLIHRLLLCAKPPRGHQNLHLQGSTRQWTRSPPPRKR